MTLEGLIKPQHINYETTAWRNYSNRYAEETEIRVKEGSPIEIVEISELDWEGSKTLKA